jgi:hypothetical protein
MRKFAAAITIPVTNTNVQDPSKTSMTNLAMVRSPYTGLL